MEIDYQKALSLLGCKFYKFNTVNGEKELEVIRVIEVKNASVVKVLNYTTKQMYKTSPEEVLKQYTKLIPDGLITFAIVELWINRDKAIGADDVIVTLYTTKDLDRKAEVPNVVCRQNITDVFYETFMRTKPDVEYVGLCLTEKTCPDNLDFRIMTACDSVKYAMGINIYIEDSIEDILFMVKKKKFDAVLENCLSEHMKSKGKLYNGKTKSFHGYCSSLKQLLEENNFEYDYNSTYNIIGLDLDLEEYMYEEEDQVGKYQTLKNDIINDLSNLFKVDITHTIVVEYDHDIDLDEIQSRYFLIRDKNKRLFLVNYTIGNEFREFDMEVTAAKIAEQNSKLKFNLGKY